MVKYNGFPPGARGNDKPGRVTLSI